MAGAYQGTFGGAPLSPGTHYLLVRRDTTAVTVQQLRGADTDVTVVPPAGRPLRLVALAGGATVRSERVTESRGVVRFRYAGVLEGRRVDGYRIVSG